MWRALRNVILIAVSLILISVLRGCVFRPATAYAGSHFNRGKNAVWLGVEWVNEAHTSAEIAALANDLRQRQIAFIFVYTSYLKSTGEFNQTFAHAGDFIRALKTTAPDLKVLAWIGLPLSYIKLDDPAIRSKIIKFSADVAKQSSFDGIHYDPELIVDGDINVLALLDETRQALGKSSILSIATHKAWPIMTDAPWSRWLGPILWSSNYYREVARRVDQVAVMIYDTGFTSPMLYRQWSRFQVIAISGALDGTGAELFFGIPTSEEETPTHHANAENMASGLQGTIDGLNDLDARPDAVTGLAIYPYWETDQSEWALYESQWLSTLARYSSKQPALQAST